MTNFWKVLNFPKVYKLKMKTNTFYHIYNRANGNESLFVEDKNYHYFMEKWEKYIAPIASIYSFCMMSSHFHFLF